ncbi:MAG TPA: response regulator transcription factor [Mycobacteriales bacterium]|nr:response regulator transcription factor [Mycobacteriales bacterium]
MRVLILDPEVAVAEALAALMSAQNCVTAAEPTTTLGGLRAALATDSYDVLVLAAESSAYDPIELVRQLRRDHPETAVVIVASDASPANVADLLLAGALCWVSKSADAEDIASVLHAASLGEASVPGAVLAGVVRHLAERQAAGAEQADVLATLTQREKDVLDAMVAGLSRREIATQMYLSVNTVRTHIQHVLSKLHAHTALEAVAIALRADPRRQSARAEWQLTDMTIELPREDARYHAV